MKIFSTRSGETSAELGGNLFPTVRAASGRHAVRDGKSDL